MSRDYLKPFFTFYGGKYKNAQVYPSPKHDTIIEPFAGSAGYSVFHRPWGSIVMPSKWTIFGLILHGFVVGLTCGIITSGLKLSWAGWIALGVSFAGSLILSSIKENRS